MDTRDQRWPSILRLVAHQLRTPTGLISGYMEMLAADEIQRDPERRQYIVAHVRECVRELNHLVVELQEASRMAARTLPIRKEPVPLASLIEEALRSAGPMCEYREVVLDSSAPARVAPGHVLGDPYYLKLCLVNLIENAAKYGKPGGHVHVSTRPLGDQMEVRVVDEGNGLGPAAPRLFAPFVQGSDAREGIGLGLALVKAIVEAHGGTITWRSGRPSYVGFRVPRSSD